MAYNIGEMPGTPRYCCIYCNWTVVLDDDTDKLGALREVRQGATHRVRALLAHHARS